MLICRRLFFLKRENLKNCFPLSKYHSTVPKLPQCNFEPEKYQGISYEEMNNIRDNHLNSLVTYYNKPVAFYQGHKQWLFDIAGNRYLDMFGGICTVSVGHSHPKITEAIVGQMKLLGHASTLYYYPKMHEYAKKLTDKFPGDLKVVYFVNSGSEANDLALLMARSYTNNYEVASLKNCYHGMTLQMMGITGNGFYKFPVPQASSHHVMNPDVYKGIWGGSNCRDSPIQTTRKCNCKESQCEAKTKYVDQFMDLFRYSVPKGHLAAFYAEAIQGVGGTVQYPKGYIKEVYDIVKNHGGLFIADEVQTGFGRTGEHFWGFEMHGITPDIVTMAKGIGNGYPLGAVVTTPRIANALTKAGYFNTFGGNPIACTVGMSVLDIIEEENLQENSKIVGTHLLKKLAELRDVFPIVGDVRGKGLMIGVELVTGEESFDPLPPSKFMGLWESCMKMGLIVGKGGLYGNVLRIKPPMCITKEDADFTVAVLRKALEELSEENYT